VSRTRRPIERADALIGGLAGAGVMKAGLVVQEITAATIVLSPLLGMIALGTSSDREGNKSGFCNF
jgi:hypothetical protein